GPHDHVAAAAVQLDAGVPGVPLEPLVGGEQGLLDRLRDDIHGDLALTLQQAQRRHVDIHQSSFPSGRENSTCTRALVTSARGTGASGAVSSERACGPTDVIRSVVVVPSARVSLTSRPTLRRSWSWVVSGRSRPAELTSSV